MERYFDLNVAPHSIRCKLYAQDARRVILCANGFGSDRDSKAMEHFAGRVLSKHRDVAVLTFDWPCHGRDVKKKLTLDDCRAYLDLLRLWVENTLGAELLGVYAVSFGGYLILNCLSRSGNPFGKLALRCPAVTMYTSLTSVFLTEDDRARLAKGKNAVIELGSRIEVTPQFLAEVREQDVFGYDYTDFSDDILLIHGTEDEIVPFERVCAFAEQNVLELVPVEGAEHTFYDPRKMDAATKAILEFFSL